MTATQAIKKHLQRGWSLTPYQAWTKYSCYRLSSIINRLRNRGMNIRTEIQFAGKSYSYARYKVVK